MKKQLLTVSLIFNALLCLGQGMDKLEIWGWEGTKEEFRQKYFEINNVDLNTTASCAVDLKKIGYEHSISIVQVKDLDEYLDYSKGKLGVDKLERVVIN